MLSSALSAFFMRLRWWGLGEQAFVHQMCALLPPRVPCLPAHILHITHPGCLTIVVQKLNWPAGGGVCGWQAVPGAAGPAGGRGGWGGRRSG